MLRALGLALAIMVALPAAAADLGGDTRRDSPILPGEKQFDSLSRDEVQAILDRLNVKPPADATTKTRLKKVIKSIELIRVEARNGNNPFNAEDPIDNATVNGIVVQQAVDDLNDNGNGDNNGAGLDACIGQTVSGVQPAGAPGIVREVSLVIDPVTLACTILTGNSVDGAFLIMDFFDGQSQVQAGQDVLQVFPDATVPVWTLVDPNVIPFEIDPFDAAQAQQFTLAANGGVFVRASLLFTPVGGDNFQVTIINLEQL